MSAMQRRTRPFTTVVGVDFSELSERAIGVAFTMARVAGEGDVHLVHALSLPVMASELAVAPDIESLVARARDQVQKLVPPFSLGSGLRVFVHVAVGIPQEVVDGVARECGADLILVGTHGRRGLKRALFGSVGECITRNAPCSVLTVRPRELPSQGPSSHRAQTA